MHRHIHTITHTHTQLRPELTSRLLGQETSSYPQQAAHAKKIIVGDSDETQTQTQTTAPNRRPSSLVKQSSLKGAPKSGLVTFGNTGQNGQNGQNDQNESSTSAQARGSFLVRQQKSKNLTSTDTDARGDNMTQTQTQTHNQSQSLLVRQGGAKNLLPTGADDHRSQTQTQTQTQTQDNHAEPRNALSRGRRVSFIDARATAQNASATGANGTGQNTSTDSSVGETAVPRLAGGSRLDGVVSREHHDQDGSFDDDSMQGKLTLEDLTGPEIDMHVEVGGGGGGGGEGGVYANEARGDHMDDDAVVGQRMIGMGAREDAYSDGGRGRDRNVDEVCCACLCVCVLFFVRMDVCCVCVFCLFVCLCVCVCRLRITDDGDEGLPAFGMYELANVACVRT
jgi:hypothetical protein